MSRIQLLFTHHNRSGKRSPSSRIPGTGSTGKALRVGPGALETQAVGEMTSVYLSVEQMFFGGSPRSLFRHLNEVAPFPRGLESVAAPPGLCSVFGL